MFSTRTVLGTVLTIALAAPSALSAQHVDGRRGALTVAAGVLGTDVNEGENFPLIAARVDWGLSRHVRVEVGGTVARGDIELANHTGPTTTFTTEKTTLATTTVGVQAELPIGAIRPYVGTATGLYLRLDPSGGDRFLSTTQEFPLGVRVDVTPRFGVRAEVRARFDNQQYGELAPGAEATVGVTLKL